MSIRGGWTSCTAAAEGASASPTSTPSGACWRATPTWSARWTPDLSHAPSYLPALVSAAETFDVVIGSRYLHGVNVVNWPLHRIALSAAANRYVRAITGAPVADCTSGFRCWRRETLGRIPLERLVSNGYAFLIETLHEAPAPRRPRRRGPIVFVERRHGHSKVSLNVIAESLAMPWWVRFRPRVRPYSDRP